MAGLDAALLAALTLGYRGLLAICFNEELARLRGVRVAVYETLLALLVAVAVVLLVKVVGVVLAIALLTLPAATAATFTRRLVPMMAAATSLCAALTVGGLALSYAPEWPAGATIILLAGGVYIMAHIAARLRGRG
jgi:zinc transport system permease protein